jgi:hypothetical protein
MATRSRIGVQLKDGSILSVYCHNDGYLQGPHGVGYKLPRFYNNPSAVMDLIELGSLSSLGEYTNLCFAYGRDRGDTGTEAAMSKNLQQFKELARGTSYTYLFRKGQWFWMQTYSDKNFRKLKLDNP